MRGMSLRRFGLLFALIIQIFLKRAFGLLVRILNEIFDATIVWGFPFLSFWGFLITWLAFSGLKVSDFIDEGRWVLDDSFHARFPDLCFRLDRIAISPVADSLVWAHSRDGQVSWWRDVWCHFIPSSRSALTWRQLLNRLPIEDHFCKVGFHLASRCNISGVNSESSDHLFLRCPLAAALWEAVFSAFQRCISVNSWSSFFSQAMSVSFSDHVLVLWKTSIHAVVWSVWLARNQWIFKSKAIEFISALSLVWHAVSDANRLEIGCMRNCVDDLLILRRFDLRGRLARAPFIRSVIWSPQAPGWIKVNIDGAALSSLVVKGCRSVFHNCRAFVKCGFAVPLGQVFAFEAELLAVSTAINLAWQNGWPRIWLENDSSYMVHLLASRSEQVPWRIRQAWQRCIYQISKMEFQDSHIFREGNQVADALSKHALRMAVDSWWTNTPSFCSLLVGNDCMGRESFRFS
ncbi:hypothetical protein Dsin_022417 [Dipteronia sinensis]|uniref:RNase H type-1 domain-containing protein n=1 Tax=Dipteronia sinensis TaxID=43782 RepID=A0AAE0E150_9ROSI|nr:hypothetical protein Dsin_022417 [Dipteronia sinensis]